MISFGMFIVYFGFCIVNKPWKLLSKPNTEEEKNERPKRLHDFIFVTGFYLITAFFFSPIVRQFFLAESGWPEIALFILNVIVIALFMAAMILWERKKK